MQVPFHTPQRWNVTVTSALLIRIQVVMNPLEQDVQALIASASCWGRGARGSVGTLTIPEHHFTQAAHLCLESEVGHIAPSRREKGSI